MPKDLTGTNVAAQKDRTYYRPAYLLTLLRDHPERGSSPDRYTTWSRGLTLAGQAYKDRILELDDVVRTIEPGGGLAVGGDWRFALLNPEDSADDRRSHMLEDYYLENDEVVYSVVFRDGQETLSDVLQLYAGIVQDAAIDTRAFRITTKDGRRRLLKTVPQEIMDLVTYPFAPLNLANTPFPIVAGNLNVEPFNTSGARPVLAPCRCVDIFNQDYTPGLLCKTYGQLYVYSRSAGLWGRIENYTQTGAIARIDSSARFTKIRPIRAAATNDVADWHLVLDGSTATSVTIAAGDNLDLQCKGSPKLGTITAIEIRVEASGSWDYVITKPGEANITGTGVNGTSIDLSSWAFDDDWDFELIEIQIDGPGAGSADIQIVSLDVAYDEQETGDQLAFPVFQAVTGYQDVAAQYQDGGLIVSAAQVLRNPLDMALALMRDRRTGSRIPVANLVTSNWATERAKISDWYFDFSLTAPMPREEFHAFLRFGKIRLFENFDGRLKLTVFDETDDPAGLFVAATNIATASPAAKPQDRTSSFQVSQAPLSEVYNEIVVEYGWDEALGQFTQMTVASPYYRTTGTATLDPAAQTLTDLSATFVTDGIQVGYRCFVVRDKLYDVTAVNSETELGITPSVVGAGIPSRSDTYYLGPNFDFNCFRSVAKYKQTNRLQLQCRYIQDADTAEKLLQHLVDYWSQRPLMVRFRTWLNAVHLELGDLLVVDHPDLPPRKRPVVLSTLAAGATKTATTLTLSGSGAALVRDEDRLVLAGAGGRLYREGVLVTATAPGAGTIDVTRAAFGSVARPWQAGDVVSRVITKWEVVGLRYIRATNEVEIEARETPRDYTPVGHAAPAGTPDYEDATPEERALYGFASYPNGEASWLDEESAVSFARTL